jgi:Heterokaryon incompatibility protein (HET)
VTPNLEAALHRLQGTLQYLWVDAICINQNDVHERNSQVSLMRPIYKNAATVRVWPGEEADDSALAMDTIIKLANAPQRAPGQASQPYAEPSDGEKLQR